MRKPFLFTLFLLLTAFSLQAQDTAEGKGYKLPYVVKDADTIPIYQYEDVQVVAELDAVDLAKQKEWYRTLFNVQKVWPYAKAAAERMKEVDSQLAVYDKKKDRKKFLREKEDILKAEFEEQLKNLSYNQGQILIKLIDRETGKSSYELIKEYKSGMSAFMWQRFATVFGMDLKQEYNPEQEEMIEKAIRYLGYK